METKPYHPSWYKCAILDEWEEEVRSGTTFGTKKVVKYLNKRGKEQTTTKWVRWEG